MWELRSTAPDLAAAYRRQGLWTDDTLGGRIADCLRGAAGEELRIWSATRPFSGTLGDGLDLARRLAGGLAARGIGPGDVVAFQLPNWVEAVAAFWGVSMLGATLVPIVHFYGAKEVGFIVRQSGARVLISADRFGHQDYRANLAAYRSEVPDLELVAMLGGGSVAEGVIGLDELLAGEPLEAPAAVDPGAPAVIAYTSGTTSNPKGVVHTSRSLLAEIIQGAMVYPSDGRPGLTGAPVGHAIGMLGGLLGPISRGSGVHLIDGWDPDTVLATLVEGDLRFGGGATYFLTSLLDAGTFRPEVHLAYLPTAGLGGSPVPTAVARRAADLGISIIRSYGSTELPSITGARHDEPEDRRHSTDGHALPGVEIRMVDPAGAPVGPGEAGQILARGPELFAGYTDPVLTKEMVDAEGWFSTGDIGVMDTEGWLTITDRISDVIIRGGENISAAEVEGLLVAMPGVAEAAVVAAPDARLGEHACAFVRLQAGAAAPSLDDVRRHLQGAGLARQKWPEELRVADDFPRTPSSKIKKYVLREQLRRDT